MNITTHVDILVLNVKCVLGYTVNVCMFELLIAIEARTLKGSS